MSDITSVLTRIERWIEGKRPALRASLRAGLGDAAIAQVAKKLGRPLDGDLEALLRWHDGSGPDGDDFLSNYRLMTAAEAAERAAMMKGHVEAGEFDDKLDWWIDGWVPFLDNGGDDWFCVDHVGSFGGTPGQVIEFWHDDASREIVAPSLAAWFGAIASAAEADLLDGPEPRDDETFDRHIAAALPGYPKAASARKNDVKTKARVSARDAIKNAIDPFTGPRAGLARPIAEEKVLKAAKHAVAEQKQSLLKRRASAVAEVFEIFPAAGEKRVAYAIWSTSTVGDNWRDGYVTGIDLKGDVILKEKKVQG